MKIKYDPRLDKIIKEIQNARLDQICGNNWDIRDTDIVNMPMNVSIVEMSGTYAFWSRSETIFEYYSKALKYF